MAYNHSFLLLEVEGGGVDLHFAITRRINAGRKTTKNSEQGSEFSNSLGTWKLEAWHE
jgi:hypothetical protein